MGKRTSNRQNHLCFKNFKKKYIKSVNQRLIMTRMGEFTETMFNKPIQIMTMETTIWRTMARPNS